MATIEQMKTLAHSTINMGGGFSSGATTLTVTDGSAFPATGVFRLLIDLEILKCTGRSGNDLTVVRGQEGTTAVLHANGATVTAVVTAASLPELIARHNFMIRRTPLDDADFTQHNWGSTTVQTTDGMMVLRSPASTVNLRSLLKTLPAAPYKITLACWFTTTNTGVACGGLYLRDSASNKVVSIALLASDVIELQKWNSDTSFNATYTNSLATASWRRYGKPIWVQLEDDNTNRISRISPDGVTFEQMHTVGRTDFVTPDQYGVFMNTESTGGDRILTVYDLKVE